MSSSKRTELSLKQIQDAAYRAWDNLGRCNTLDAGVKREMCEILNCDPHELEAAMTDEVVGSIFYPTI